MSTDSEILRRSVDDPRVFSDLFRRHGQVVGAFAARRVGGAAAEDIVSDTFLVAFRRRADFDHSWDSARPWLLGIASRLIRKHRGDEAAQWRAFLASVPSAQTSTDGDIDRVAIRTDAEATIRELTPRIAKLAVRDREALLLYAWGDLTYEQVAIAQGVPVGTVRSRLSRVRRKLDHTVAPSGRSDNHAKSGNHAKEEEPDGRIGSRA